MSSPYDSYILEEDGQLSESLDAEFYQLNLATSPRITQVPTAEEALALLEKRPFDLVITMARLGGMYVSTGRWTCASTAARGAVSCSEKHSAADDVQETRGRRGAGLGSAVIDPSATCPRVRAEPDPELCS